MTAKMALPADKKPAVEEVFYRNSAVSLCLLVNRRAKTMRVIDFRAGPSAAKKQTVLTLAEREGVDKVFTLVERDEVSTWVKLGFEKEGNIPGFYKRSDAFLLGRTVARNGSKKAARPVRHDDVAATPDEMDPAVILAEKTIVIAKKHAKELADRQLPAAKMAKVPDADVKRPLSTALKNGRALTAFEPFGRDVERRYYSITARGGFELLVSTEAQSCFGNTFVELLTSPSTNDARLATVAALRLICDRLTSEGVVSCFSLAPSDDVALATAFVFNGFRRTGILQNHLFVGGERRDAIIWSRKLANPADE
jgi:hypothetical protein